MSAGRFDDAAAIYQEMLRSLPDEPGLLMNLGMALAMGGHEAEALAPLERAIKLKPDLIPAHLFLGSSYLALGKADKAVAPLERAVAARPRISSSAECSRRPTLPSTVRSMRSLSCARSLSWPQGCRRVGMHLATGTTR